MGGRTRRPTLLGSFLVLACTLALAVVPSAQAANDIPNPGFETNCGGIPCNWSTTGVLNTTIAYDTVNPHPPSTASIKVTVSQNGGAAGPTSDCVPIALAAASYSTSFWYRTTGALTFVPSIAAQGYTSNNCSLGGFSIPIVSAPTTLNDGQWHQVSGTVMSPFAAQSVRFQVFFGCNCVPGLSSVTVNFDDVDFEPTPLAVTVYGLRAVRSHRSVVLRWRTGTEADTLGFNVYRQQGGRRVRVNRRLLPALGGISGTSYSYRDRRAPKHRMLRYWMQDVAVDGARTWHGPVRVSGA